LPFAPFVAIRRIYIDRDAIPGLWIYQVNMSLIERTSNATIQHANQLSGKSICWFGLASVRRESPIAGGGIIF
jgi:hypothetical protein